MIWLLVSRLVLSVPSMRLVRFPRIGLRLGNVRRFCQLVLLCHSVGGGAYRFLSRLVFRLVCPSRVASRLYSLRFARRLVLLINSLGVSLSRFVRRPGSPSCLSFLGVSPCSAHRSPSRPSSRPLVSSSSRCSLVSPGGSWCRVVSLRLVLFCSCLISLVASHGHGGGSSFVVSFRSSRGCVFLSLLSSVIVGRGDGGVSVPFDDTKDAPFSSARFLIG